LNKGFWIRACWSAGMLIWYLLFLWRVRIPRDHAAAVAVAGMVCGYLFGRALGGYQSTAAFTGAILGGFAWLAVRKQLGSWMEILEAGSFALPFAWISVRLGCVIERGHPGLVTESWLGLRYPDGVTRWDLALLEMMWAAAVALLFTLYKPKLRYEVWLPGTLALFRLAILPLQAGPPEFISPAILGLWCLFVALRER
jgi:hypothetical protein